MAFKDADEVRHYIGGVFRAGFEDADPQVPEFGVALGQVSEALVPDEVLDLVLVDRHSRM